MHFPNGPKDHQKKTLKHGVWKSKKKYHSKINIVGEASSVYILSGQKLIKNAKNAQFGEFLKV